MEKEGISYEDLDVSANKEAREEMVRKSKQMGVPVIEIDGDITVGFDEPRLRQKLGLAKTQ